MLSIRIGEIVSYDPIKQKGTFSSDDQIIHFSLKYVRALWLDKHKGTLNWKNRYFLKTKPPEIGDMVYFSDKKDKNSEKLVAPCWGFCEESGSGVSSCVIEKS